MQNSTFFIRFRTWMAVIVLSWPLWSARTQDALCPPPQGIVAWWTGDVDGGDSSGSNHGSLVGDANVGFGLVGQGFHFGGTGALDVPDSPSFAFGINDFSVEFWIQFSNLQDGANGILSKDDFTGEMSSATGWLINICAGCGDGSYGVGDGGFGFETRHVNGNTGPHTHARWATSNLSSGVWYHVAAVRSASVLYLYIDGVLRATMAEPAPTDVNTPAGLTIGTLNSIHTQSFNGLLDEVTVFGRALSGAEIAQTFAAGASGKCKNNGTAPDPKNLVFNGTFEDGNIGFATDYSYRSDDLHPETSYTVGANPVSFHGSFYPATDHTSGTGRMLVVNGATSEGIVVWKQTLAIEPGVSFRFSAWAANLVAGNPAPNLALYVNGANLGSPKRLHSSHLGFWTEIFSTWASGDATSAVLEIRDLETAAGGNDFALDDIAFSATAPGIVSQLADVLANVGDTVTWTVTPFGAAPFTFQWRKNGVDLPGQIGAGLTLDNVQLPATGYYSIVVRNSVGAYTSAPIQLRFTAGTAVSFADAKLEGSVRSALGKPTGGLTVADMELLTSLNARDQGIQNLAGLEAALNLVGADFAHNRVSDVKPLSGLTFVRALNLEDNQITDIAPLANCQQIDDLNLAWGGNRYSSFAPLQNLSRLIHLNVSGTGLTDYSVLTAERFPNLRDFYCANNGLTDANFLRGMTKRLVTLFMDSNPIASLAPLEGFSDLSNLNVSDTGIKDYSILTAAAFPNLRQLHLAGNGVRDLGFVSQLNTEVYLLGLDRNPLTALTPLVHLPKLNWLFIRGTGVTDYSVLTADRFPNLRFFLAGGNGYRDINFLTWMPQLFMVDIGGNPITDLRPLVSQTQLQTVWANESWVSDIEVLRDLPNLREVYIGNDRLDLTPGSTARSVISSLQNRGVSVAFEPQKALPGEPGTIAGKSVFSGQNIFDLFTAGDPARVADIVSVTATSSNQSVVRDADLIVRGQGLVRSLEAPTQNGVSGLTMVTVTITYRSGESVSGHFNIATTALSPGTLFIEAEDFDYNHGHWIQDQPIGMDGPYRGGSYAGLGGAADRGVDLSTVYADRSQRYRPGTGAVLFDSNRNNNPDTVHRGTFDVEVNFVLVWNDQGNWYNYTRSFPSGFYQVYASQASGGAFEHAALNEVVAGAGTTSQVMSRLGRFDSPGFGSDQNYHLVPLRTTAGELAPVYLSGARTLRLSADSTEAPYMDYFAFVPVPTPDPGIQEQPADVLVAVGGPVTLSVTPVGTAPFSFQWRKNGLDIAGETGATLALNNVQTSATGDYSVVVRNALGKYTSQPVQLRFPGTAVVTFADANLEAAVRAQLNQPAVPISISDMSRMDRLDTGAGRSIRNLQGLETAINLGVADLRNNQISDLTPIGGLGSLGYLYLGSNQITNIAPLAYLTHLDSLEIHENQIRDISGLSSLTQLRSLNLSGNPIQSFGPLASLTNLTGLVIDRTHFTDITPLSGLVKLDNLFLTFNPIQSLTPIQNLTNLQRLAIGNTGLSDLSILTSARFPNVHSLWADGNGIQNLEFLRRMSLRLSSLNVGNNPITSLAPLEGFSELTTLEISGTAISDFSILTSSRFPKLTSLHAQSANLRDLEFLQALPLLQLLNVSWNPLTDIRPIATLGHLIWLDIRGCWVSELSALRSLSPLSFFVCEWNYLDVAPGSEARAVIDRLAAQGGTLDFEPQRDPPPGVGSLGARASYAGRPIPAFEFAAGDRARAGDIVSMAAVSANQGIVRDVDITVRGFGLVHAIEIRPAALATGSVTITLTVNYGTGPSTTGSFLVTTDAGRAVARDRVGNVGLTILGGADYSADGLGHTGLATDYALDFGYGLNKAAASTKDAEFLNAAAAGDTITISVWQKLREVSDSTIFNGIGFSGPHGILAHFPWTDNQVYFDTGFCCGDGARQRISKNIAEFPGYSGSPSWWRSWHHLAVTKNGAQKRVYIDGTLFFEGSSTDPLPLNFQTLWLGTHDAQYFNAPHGWVDDLAIFNDALTPAQVAALAQGASPVSLPGLTAFWDFNDAPARTSPALDPILATAIRDELRISDRPLGDADLLSLTRLSLYGKGVLNLAGIEKAVNLTWLDLSVDGALSADAPERTRDLTVLSQLPNLEWLNLSGSALTSIDFLRSMPRLQHLGMDNFPNVMAISDYSPLARATSLTEIWMQAHSLGSAGIFKGLKKLSSLSLNWGSVPDASDLATLPELKFLHLYHVGLTSIEFLRGMTQLQVLSLGQFGSSAVPISSLSLLQNLTGLTWLSLDGRSISSADQIVPFLRGMTQLRELWLSGTSLADGSALSQLGQLNRLGLSNTQLTSLQFLRDLPQLIGLDVANWNRTMRIPVSDWDLFADLPNLVDLNASGHGLKELGFLASNNALQSLSLDQNSLTDFSLLVSKPQLNTLRLNGNILTDLSPGLAMTALRHLEAGNNPITPPAINGGRDVIAELRGRGVTVIANVLPVGLTLPTTQRLASSAGLIRGFSGRIHQTPSAPYDNTLLRAEQQLAGIFGPSDEPVEFIEGGAVNYDNDGLNLGRFGGNINFPNLSGLRRDHLAASLTAHVELKAGWYVMGINSDDSFGLSSGFEPLYQPIVGTTTWLPNSGAKILGSFDGGRGAGDTYFLVEAPEDGLYPLRLLWEEGGGEASLEWWVVDLQTPAGARQIRLVNDLDDLAAPKAYTMPPATVSAPHVTAGPVPAMVLEAGSKAPVMISTWVSDAETSTREILSTMNVTVSTTTPAVLPEGTFRMTRTTEGLFLEIRPELAKPGLGALEVTATDAGGLSSSAEMTFSVVDPSNTVGYLRREIYEGIAGNNVANLVSSPDFPDHPTKTFLIPSLEAPSYSDNYGQRISGYLMPPVTGDYVFYLASDDGGELWFSTDDTPGGKVKIATEPIWSSFRHYLDSLNRNASAPENRSAPIHLEVGKAYYLEVLQKEGGGGDHVAVAWQIPGGSPPADGSEPIPGRHFSANHPTADQLPGTDPGIQEQPADVLADAGANVILSVTPVGTAPFSFQWRKNGLDLPGQTGSSLTLNSVQTSATGRYSVVVRNTAGTYTSEPIQVRFPSNAVVTFEDINLELAVRGSLNKPAGAVTVGDMETLTGLEANHVNIRTLSGLEAAINLINLGMRQNPIADLTPLAGLVRLVNLGLERDQITDLTPLAGCVALENLGLDGNRIQTLEPLRNCIRIFGLGISETGVTDYSILTAQNFPNLTNFRATGNGILDLEFLRVMSRKLSILEVRDNPITSLAPLEGLTDLTSLEISRTFVSDVSILTASRFPKLRALGAEVTRIVDVSFVQELPQLQLLNIAWNLITDIRPVAGLTQLNWLKILGCSISDISPLNTLSPLGFFDCGWNMLDITPGSAARQTIAHLSAPGGTLIFEPQRGFPVGMTSLGQRSSYAGQPIPIFDFTVGDPARVGDLVSVTATSSNQGIVRDADIILRGFGIVHSAEIRPVTQSTGSTVITLTAIYRSGPSVSSSFTVTTDAGRAVAHDRVGNLGLTFLGGADYSPDGLGRTGVGSDYALDFGYGENKAAATTAEARFLNAAAAGDTLTVSVWQKLREVSNATLFLGSSPSQGRGLLSHVPFGDNTLYFDTTGCCDPATQRVFRNISQFPAYTGSTAWWGSWHHFVFTKSGPTKRVYIDGVPFLEGSNTGVLAQDFETFWLGTYNGNDFSAPHGWVDDLAIFNDALTPAQIAELAQGGNPASISGLAAFWDFNDPPPVAPNLVSEPGTQAVFRGQSASLRVLARGPSLVYRWFKGATELSDNDRISGARTTVLRISGVLDSDGGDYTVRVSNALGTAESGLAGLIVHPSEPPAGLGFARREVYPDIPGVRLNDLRASPAFPDHPSQVELITALEMPSTGDNYGQRLSGLLWPPVTGDYVFYLAADNEAALYLSTDDQPANAVLIAWEPQWSSFREYHASARRNPDAPENRSGPIHLEVGRGYYIEALQKEEGGGSADHVSVAWQLPGGQPPLNGSEPLAGGYLSANLPELVKPLILEAPTAKALSVGQRETLSARAVGLNVVYRWRRNGVDLTDNGRVSGSQTSTLVFVPFLESDTGLYSVVARNAAGDDESEGALVTARQPGDYVQLPAGSRVVPDLGKPGFSASVHQVGITQADTLNRAERQLLELLKDAQGNPLQNLANQAAVGPDGRFAIPGVINLNAIAGTSFGHFIPDAPMPGIPGQTGSFNNIAMEILTYLELPQGVVRMGINSDDGFETSAGAVKDLFERTVIGRFDGGRGAADSIYEFYVPEAGVYPFRTIYEQGGGDANVEWFTFKPDGSPVLLNDTTHGGFAAYRQIVPTEPVVSVALVEPARNAREVKLNAPISVTLLDPAAKLQLSSIHMDVSGLAVTSEVRAAAGRVTVLYAPTSIYPADTTIPVRLSFSDTTGVSREIQWSFRSSVLAPGTLFIEAEDFDFGKGQWVENVPTGMTGPYPGGAYQGLGNGLGGTPGDGSDLGVDYFENPSTNDGPFYRPQTAVEANPRDFSSVPASRGAFDVQVNYGLGWNNTGDWYNYTRRFPEPARRYRVYASLSSGGQPIAGELGLVASGRGTSNQTVQPLGEFRPGRATGGWDNFELFELTDANGHPVQPVLGGLSTLRFTVLPGNLDFDFMAFVPIPEPKVNLVGTVRYYANGNPAIPGVRFVLGGAASQAATTDGSGGFAFVADAGSDYTIDATKVGELPASQGVTTLDITLVRRDVLGIARLDSPYKLLAADANRSGSVSTLDITFMRRVILGIANDFPAGGWMFVPADHAFANPAAPWGYDAVRHYAGLNASQTGQDFIGVKIGDVNGSWTPPTATPPPPPSPEGYSSARQSTTSGSVSERQEAVMFPTLTPNRNTTGSGVRLSVDTVIAGGGAEFDVPVRLFASGKVTSLQFSLAWNPAVFEFVRTGNLGIRGLGDGNLNVQSAAVAGRLSLSWDDPEGQGVDGSNEETGLELMRLTFRTRSSQPSAGVVGFVSTPTPLEVVVDFQAAPTQAVDGWIWLGRTQADAAMRLPSFSGQTGELQIPTWLGLKSVIETKDDLDAGEWRVVESLDGDGTARGFPVTVSGRRQAYYRVRFEP